MHQSRTEAFKYWMPVFLWMGVIFVMSTDAGSAAHTSVIIEPIVLWLKPNASHEEFEFVHFIIRKLGHLSEYAVLGLLVLRALKHTRPTAPGKWSWQTAGATLLVAAAYAATDEWHQSFVPGRTSALGDVLIDSSGAAVGLSVMLLRHKLAASGLCPTTAPHIAIEPSCKQKQSDRSKSDVL